jgi:hypothetical protein
MILGDVLQLDVGLEFLAQGEIIQFFGGRKKPVGADVVGGEFLLLVTPWGCRLTGLFSPACAAPTT